MAKENATCFWDAIGSAEQIRSPGEPLAQLTAAGRWKGLAHWPSDPWSTVLVIPLQLLIKCLYSSTQLMHAQLCRSLMRVHLVFVTRLAAKSEHAIQMNHFAQTIAALSTSESKLCQWFSTVTTLHNRHTIMITSLVISYRKEIAGGFYAAGSGD